jgi:hypothetical protein
LADRVDAVEVGRLQASGVSQAAIEVYLRYGRQEPGPVAGTTGTEGGDPARGGDSGPDAAMASVREGVPG